jgi:hypothetical protein
MSQTYHHMVSNDERPRPGTYPGQCRMRTTNAKRREESSPALGHAIADGAVQQPCVDDVGVGEPVLDRLADISFVGEEPAWG